jgi:anaerobic selenocysteine-containing dehydrogenase
MHPKDAAEHGVADGVLVTVSSDAGRLTLPAQVTEAVSIGSVSIPHGWGETNVNILTSRADLDSLTGMPAFSGTPVQVAVAG